MNEIANRLRRLSNNLKEMKCIDCIDQLDKDIDEIEKLSQDYDELKSRFSRIDEPKKVLYIDRQRTMYKKKWGKNARYDGVCPCCSGHIYPRYNYCPNCGQKIRYILIEGVSNMSEEKMELLKDICTWKAEEYRWVSNDKFCVWVHYFNIEEFMNELRTICDFDPYDDVLDAQIQDYCVCIELTARLFDKDELEEIFPKENFK